MLKYYKGLVKSITMSVVQLKNSALLSHSSGATGPNWTCRNQENSTTQQSHARCHCGLTSYVSACSSGKRHRLVMNMSQDRKDKTSGHVVADLPSSSRITPDRWRLTRVRAACPSLVRRSKKPNPSRDGDGKPRVSFFMRLHF